jgi:hypothetical protein
MAKGKRKRGTPSKANKAMNAALMGVAFAPAIRIVMDNLDNTDNMMRELQLAYTGFGVDGTFKAERLTQGYVPVVLAFVLFEIKKQARRKFRF